MDPMKRIIIVRFLSLPGFLSLYIYPSSPLPTPALENAIRKVSEQRSRPALSIVARINRGIRARHQKSLVYPND